MEAPPADIRIRAVGAITLVAWLSAALALVSVTGSRHVHAAAPARPSALAVDVAWLPQPSPPFPVPVTAPSPAPPADAPPCRPRALHAFEDGGNGAGGDTITNVRFTNVSTVTCSLTGYPTVTASEPGHPSVLATRGVVFTVPNPGGNITPGASALVSLETERDCDARYRDPVAFPTLIYRTVAFAFDGGTTRLTTRLDVFCGLRTSTFTVEPPPAREQPVVVLPITPVMTLPAEAHPGQLLTYVITLTNQSDNAVALDPCPGYLQWTADTTPPIKQGFGLNCDTVHQLPPRGSIRFAMQMDIPRGTPRRRIRIRWELAVPGAPQATGDVDVL